MLALTGDGDDAVLWGQKDKQTQLHDCQWKTDQHTAHCPALKEVVENFCVTK